MEEITERLIALETRATHFERVAEDLSDIIAGQADTIATLTAQIRHLASRIGDMESGWGGPSPQDSKPPPHY